VVDSWWDVVAFISISTLAWLIVPRLAENLPYFSRHMDLSVAYNMQEGTLESLEFKYLNEIAAYMLHALAESQSMGKLLYAFKNVRNMEKFLEENAAPPGGRQPLLTHRPWLSQFHFPSVAYASIHTTKS
jgi:hypothetical protein